MNKTKLMIAVGLGLAQLGTSTADAQDTLKLKDVVISTTKNDQKQSQTGKVVSIITRETLARSYGKSLPELINEQAGITVAGAGSNPGLNKSVFVRGAGSAYALVLIDGIAQSDPSGNGGAFDLRLFAIDQIDHIEILRGGQSTIYGSDAIGGVINIITKKGGQKGNTVSGVGSIGSYGTYKGTIGLNGGVEGFSYNVNYTHQKSDGISEAENPIGDNTAFDRDNYKADGVNANFSIQLDKGFAVNPFIRYYRGNYKLDEGAFADGLADNNTTLKNFSTGVNSKFEINTGKINLNYSYQTSTNNTLGSFSGFPYNSSAKGIVNLIDLFYNQKLGSKLDLLAGIDHRVMQLRSGSSSAETNIFAAYGSLFLHDLSVFNLEVGGRYNKHEQYGENYTYTITPTFNVIKGIKLFGTVSTAFKIPTLTMLFGQYGANLDLKPEKSRNYEAGVAFSFADGQYAMRIAGFKRDLTDAIIYDFATGYINQESQKIKGFEIEPRISVWKMDISGFYAYVNGNEYNNISYKVEDFLFRRPVHSYGLTAGIQATTNLFINANLRYNRTRKDGDFNTYQIVTLPNYKLVNAYAEYAFVNKKVKIFFDAKNILNEKYNEIIGYNAMGFNFNTGVSFNIR